MAQLAFPTAVGPAKNITAGKYGVIRYVTNKNDSGSGSFRAAVEDDVPAIVVFLVGGFFNLSSNISVGSNKTILGGLCPGHAPTFRYRTFRLSSGKSNIIVRYIRSRLGDTSGLSIDSFTASNTSNFIMDHCSFSWSVDEIASTVSGSNNYSIQNCIISEALHDSVHSDNARHGFAGIIGGVNVCFFQNILSHFWLRGPRISDNTDIFDMRNCLTYNWGSRPTRGGVLSKSNLLNNYYKPGPATLAAAGWEVATHFLFPTGDGESGTYGKFYAEGNFLEGTDLGSTVEDQWIGIRLENTTNNNLYLEDTKNKDELGNIVIHELPSDWYGDQEVTAIEARDKCLAGSGASITRDSHDIRLVGEINNGTYTFKGSVTGFLGIIDSQNDVGGWGSEINTPNVLTGIEANAYIPQDIIDEFDLDMTKDYVASGNPATAPWKYIFFDDGVATNYSVTAPEGWEDITHYHIMEVILMKLNGEYDLLVDEVTPPTTYTLTIQSTTGGTTNITTATEIAGTNISLVATADELYEFVRWRRVDNNQTVNLNASFTYQMPSQNLTIEAVFSLINIPPIEGGNLFCARNQPIT